MGTRLSAQSEQSGSECALLEKGDSQASIESEHYRGLRLSAANPAPPRASMRLKSRGGHISSARLSVGQEVRRSAQVPKLGRAHFGLSRRIGVSEAS